LWGHSVYIYSVDALTVSRDLSHRQSQIKQIKHH